jgi:hypothetical protein
MVTMTAEAKAKRVIEEQFQRDFETLGKLATELNLPMSAEELLKYSGLTIGRYKVKSRYTYLKLIGILTGELSDKEERWLVKKLEGGAERKRKFRRKSQHLLNIKQTQEMELKLLQLVRYWRRAKALQRWLEEAQEI